MKKRKSIMGILAAVLCCVLLSAGVVYADTDGTELQIAQPMTLEL